MRITGDRAHLLLLELAGITNENCHLMAISKRTLNDQLAGLAVGPEYENFHA